MARKPVTPEELAALKAEMERLDQSWQRKYIGYHNNAETYDAVKLECEKYIAASYAYQKAKWGKVMVQMSAGYLMRGGL
jgi:hypothetical protein